MGKENIWCDIEVEEQKVHSNKNQIFKKYLDMLVTH